MQDYRDWESCHQSAARNRESRQATLPQGDGPKRSSNRPGTIPIGFESGSIQTTLEIRPRVLDHLVGQTGIIRLNRL